MRARMPTMLARRYTLFYSPEQLRGFVEMVDPETNGGGRGVGSANEAGDGGSADVGLVLSADWEATLYGDDDADPSSPLPRLLFRRVLKVRRAKLSTPAERAVRLRQLAVGQVVEAVDGHSPLLAESALSPPPSALGDDGRLLDHVHSLLRGPEGSSLTLSVRDEASFLTSHLYATSALHAPPARVPEGSVKLQRSSVRTELAVWGTVVTTGRTGPRVGYMRVLDFNSRTLGEFRAVFKQLSGDRLPPPDVYVLDLRDNMGGLLTAGLGLCDLLLPKGSEIVTIVGMNGPLVTHRVEAASALLPPSTPLVVLVNEATASSSELVAGALRDNGRSVLAGAATFGKATIQAVVRLSDGSAVQLTIGRFRSPANSLVPLRGIEPDFAWERLAADEAAVKEIASILTMVLTKS